MTDNKMHEIKKANDDSGMTIHCEFCYEQLVRHRLTEFQGYIVGVAIRPTSVEYEVLPVTDESANWRNAVWVDERFLELVKRKGGQRD